MRSVSVAPSPLLTDGGLMLTDQMRGRARITWRGFGIRRSPLHKPIELRSLKDALFDVKTYILEQEERPT